MSMRDLTKTIMSAMLGAWMLPIRGMLNSLTCDGDACAAADALFHAGDTMQRGIVDLMLSLMAPVIADARWCVPGVPDTPFTRRSSVMNL